MSATFKPFKIDGDTHKAYFHLQLCFSGGRYGRIPQEILDAISSWHPTQRLELLPTWDTRGHSPKVEEYMIRTRNFEPRNLPVEVGWASLTWLPEKGVTRVGMRPLLMAEEPMKKLWAWLRDTLDEQGLLVDDPEAAKEEKPIRPKWWPKQPATKARWKRAYRQIRPSLDDKKHPYTYAAIARKFGLDPKHVSRVVQWAELDPEAHM